MTVLLEELYGLMTLGSVDVGVREEFTFAPHTEDFTMSTKDLVQASLIMSETMPRKLPLTRIEVGAEDFRNHALSHIAAATEYLLWLQHNRFLGRERDLDSLPLLYDEKLADQLGVEPKFDAIIKAASSSGLVGGQDLQGQKIEQLLSAPMAPEEPPLPFYHTNLMLCIGRVPTH
jgi:hypothetical protein